MKGGGEMIGTMIDTMVSNQNMGSQNTSSSNVDSMTGSNATSEFENVLQKKIDSANSKTDTDSTNDSGTVSSENVEDSEGNVELESGDDVPLVQQELMAALNMPVVMYREFENQTVVDVEFTDDGEITDVSLLDEMTLEFDDFSEGEIILTEEVLVDEEMFDIPLSLENEGEQSELLVEKVVEENQEFELIEEPEVETAIHVENEDNVPESEDLEQEGTESVEVDSGKETDEENLEDDSEPEKAVVQEVRVFEKNQGTPVKVSNVVNTQEPGMESKMAKIISQAHDAGENTVTIRLNPEGLGTVTVQITQTLEGELQVVMEATDDSAVTLLKNQVSQLVQALQNAGHSNVTVEVHSSEESEQGEQSDEKDNDQRSGEQEHHKEDKDEEDIPCTEDFLQQLRLGIASFSLELERQEV